MYYNNLLFLYIFLPFEKAQNMQKCKHDVDFAFVRY